MNNSETLLTWVHLSDFHFEATKGSIIADQALILDEIIKDIATYKNRGTPKPDLIILSGDIAQTGGASSIDDAAGEYTFASKIINLLQGTLAIDKEACLVVPGNHDINRSNKDKNISRLLTMLREGNELIDDALTDTNDSLLITKRMESYISFANQVAPLGISKSGNTWWSSEYMRNDTVIRFVGLNTSLLSLSDDKGKLQLGNLQLKELFVEKSTPEDGITIVVSHHPVEWLRDWENVQPYIQKKADVHIFGHVHDSNFQSIKKGSGQGVTEITAGAAYCSEKGYHKYSYNICSVIKKQSGDIDLRCWPRVWSQKNKEFRDDTENLGDQQNYIEHVIKVQKYFQKQEPVVETKINVTQKDTGSIAINVKVLKDNLECDPPPFSSAWVGRETELGIIKDPSIKVFAITGIGGQGKSALASKVIEEIDSLKEEKVYWDWRDCRELGDTFQTHLIRMIERLTHGKVSAIAFLGEEISTTIHYFFDLIKDDVPRYFVLDNIDHYIDVEAKKPIGPMKLFIDAALTRNHRSKIILTCRPFLQCDSHSFFEISLPGLSIEETQKLFEQRGINADEQVRKEIYLVQNLTQGHPLWLNLIATQVAKNKCSLSKLIEEIKKGKESGIPFPTLDSIWKTLNDKQKLVLKCMAETVRPESEARLEEYLAHELNFNQFCKSIRSLKLLNLVVEKKSASQKELLELHPLIKTYIKSQFPKQERKKYIELITIYYDKTMQKCRKELNKCASFAMLEYWVLRTELSINAGLLEDALETISEVDEALCASGHSIEFLRVCGDLFDELDFVDAVLNEYEKFDGVFHSFIDTLSKHERYEEAENYLEKYKSATSGKSSRYINYCDMLCHMYWCKRDYTKAVHWGRTGSELKKNHNLDTVFDCGHNLALSLRDNGEVDEALSFFLKGEPLEEVIKLGSVDSKKGGHFYGNIGRCLWFKGDINSALICYKKAISILQTDNGDDTYDNRGWGCFWLAEALEKKKDYTKSYCLYIKAKIFWDKISPPRALLAENKATDLASKFVNLTAMDEMQIERQFQLYLDS